MDLLELEIDDEDIRMDRMNEPYGTQEEFLHDASAEIDHRLFLYYKYHQWVGPENDMKNMLGLVVTRHEFEHNLSKASEARLLDKCDENERRDMKAARDVVESRLRATDPDAFPFVRLFSRFELSYAEKCTVLLSFFSENADKYRKIDAYLQDDVARKNPEVSFVSDLFGDEIPIPEMKRKFIEPSPFLSLFDDSLLKKGLLALKKEVIGFLFGSELMPDGFSLHKAGKEMPLLIRRETGKRLDTVFNITDSAVMISGRKGIGREYQAVSAAMRNGSSALVADLEFSDNKTAALHEADMLSRLFDAVLVIKGMEEYEDGNPVPPVNELRAALEKLKPRKSPLFLLSEKILHLHLSLSAISIELEDTTVDERIVLFEYGFKDVELSKDTAVDEIAVKFHFTPMQVRDACRRALGIYEVDRTPLDPQTISECCYGEVVTKLDQLARRVRGKYTWDDIVIPNEIKRLVKQAIAHVKYHHKIYSEWGFGQKLTYGTGVSILFAGVPGTGKTMCAQIIARELNMEMYKVNLSQIVSKYIGETEKNLQAVFSEARNSNCILFFDECDSLFGKRSSEVKDSNDRNANVETAYLLQQIEEYDGVCVLATNLLQNIDEAFLRRITFVVHFPFPDKVSREEIFHRTFPKGMPLSDDIDWKFIAGKFELSGGYIKNIVLSASFLAAEEGTIVSMRHMINAAVDEMRKNGIVVVRETLAEYADLLDE
ncbi:ATPase family associated with various cellular activities (AAA) [Lachnospiraceae bacterium]|nr:ATPase family associated with various cellular activities (AAA) [Lachnospiraceae bacterium]